MNCAKTCLFGFQYRSLSTLAINWEPQLRGYTVVIIAAVVLIGGTYLVVGTNLGARLGFLVILAGLFGWMVAMGAIWWTYGIGLKGREPSPPSTRTDRRE
ncbi:MAG: hypothetical protein EBV42_02505 [Actinobacteria bacterium]|nr:hypothetical protein [Actinomycetota bacterium]